MPAADRINTLWGLLRANSSEGGRARRRLGAGAALTTLMSGLLTAIGLGIVVVGFAALVLIGVSGAAAARALPGHWPRVRAVLGTFLARALRRSGVALGIARTKLRRVRPFALSLLTWLRLKGLDLARVSAERASWAQQHVATSADSTVRRMREGADRVQRKRLLQGTRPIDLQRKALRLNASGTRHRRNGAHAEAVALHRRALEILQRLDDRRAAALTMNNLALALSHVGDDASAIAMFEEAAAILRELGDEEHEGRIIANLGLAHRRHGRYEQSENVLQFALTKLTPASRAYETVEAELSRAS
jgi:tetratricopeptide (TPR) repeat protein